MNDSIRYQRNYLNLAGMENHSWVDGPGLRTTIWVQGCSIRCKGCINAQFWDERPNRMVSVQALGSYILQENSIEGVSFSGGEPFQQSKALSLLCKLLKSRKPALSFFAYSGFTHSQLKQNEDVWVHRFLSHIDILVAGPYDLNKKCNLKWRASSNQKVHFLTHRYSKDELFKEVPKVQITFNAGGQAVFQGLDLQSPKLKSMIKILAKKGIHIQ